MIHVRVNPGATDQRTASNRYIINFETAQPFGPLGKAISKASPVTSSWRLIPGSLRTAIQQWLVAVSGLPVDGVFFEVCVHRAAYRRIEVGGTEAIE